MPNRASPLTWEERGAAPARGLTREAIVRAAVALADRDGLDAVSIRRVAAELGARPMSLYSHIAAKDDLLDLMIDAVVGEVVLDGEPPGDWREALRQIAQRSHAAFVAHPWMLEASGRRGALGPSALRHAEQLLAAVAPLALGARDAWAVAGLLNDYTLGHALRVAHAAAGSSRGRYPAIDAETFPHLAGALAAGGLDRDEATFAAGLEAVLDGIERRFAG